MYLDRETIITAPKQIEPKQSTPALANKPGEPTGASVDEAAPFAEQAAAAAQEDAGEKVKERVRQVIPLEAEPAAAGMFSKLNWKHYTAVAIVLLALVGGSLALINKDKGEATQPQTPPAAATDQNAAQPADQAAPPPPQQNTEQAQSNTSASEKKKPAKREAKKEDKKGILDKVGDTVEKGVNIVKKIKPKKKN